MITLKSDEHFWRWVIRNRGTGLLLSPPFIKFFPWPQYQQQKMVTATFAAAAAAAAKFCALSNKCRQQWHLQDNHISE
jgi:hypothetical protein